MSKTDSTVAAVRDRDDSARCMPVRRAQLRSALLSGTLGSGQTRTYAVCWSVTCYHTENYFTLTACQNQSKSGVGRFRVPIHPQEGIYPG